MSRMKVYTIPYGHAEYMPGYKLTTSIGDRAANVGAIWCNPGRFGYENFYYYYLSPNNYYTYDMDSLKKLGGHSKISKIVNKLYLPCFAGAKIKSAVTSLPFEKQKKIITIMTRELFKRKVFCKKSKGFVKVMNLMKAEYLVTVDL